MIFLFLFFSLYPPFSLSVHPYVYLSVRLHDSVINFNWLVPHLFIYLFIYFFSFESGLSSYHDRNLYFISILFQFYFNFISILFHYFLICTSLYGKIFPIHHDGQWHQKNLKRYIRINCKNIQTFNIR